ncbi:MAG: 30S ribosomal protein S5 [Candidatus Pacebacteria bacterium]|nr:30S ribosomal protein S5 [Candidatus Paceibacterota bacterium]
MLKNTKKAKESKEEELNFQVLDIARVTRVTAGGRRLRFRVAVVGGDLNGRVGLGLAKANDVRNAIEKAKKKVSKNLISVPIKNETIPFEVQEKYNSATVFLKPQKKGRGIVAGGAVRVVCELAGIPNITGKLISKTSNKINVAKATLMALEKLNEFNIKD